MMYCLFHVPVYDIFPTHSVLYTISLSHGYVFNAHFRVYSQAFGFIVSFGEVMVQLLLESCHELNLVSLFQ